MGEGLSDRGVATGEASEMRRDIWAVGADLSPFSRADLGIKWHEIEHRPGFPQRQGSPRPGGENAEGAGVGGVAGCHAWLLLGADGGRMEGGWASSSSLAPPHPPLSSDKRRVCQTPASD